MRQDKKTETSVLQCVIRHNDAHSGPALLGDVNEREYGGVTQVECDDN